MQIRQGGEVRECHHREIRSNRGANAVVVESAGRGADPAGLGPAVAAVRHDSHMDEAPLPGTPALLVQNSVLFGTTDASATRDDDEKRR